MSEENLKQWRAIEVMRTDIKWIKGEIKKTNEAVSNHLPSKIDCLERKVTQNQMKTYNWIIGILVSLVFLLIGTLLNLLK